MAALRRALVAIAPGSEDLEVVAVVDILRRALFSVTLASTTPAAHPVTLARETRILPDDALATLPPTLWDVVVVPGGMPGATHLAGDATLGSLLRAQRAEGRWVAAICAAPAVVLGPLGLLEGVSLYTAHGSFVDRLPNPTNPGVELRVAVDAPTRTVTSRGPGTAVEFALAIVAAVDGQAAADAVAAPMHMAGMPRRE